MSSDLQPHRRSDEKVARFRDSDKSKSPCGELEGNCVKPESGVYGLTYACLWWCSCDEEHVTGRTSCSIVIH